MAGSSSKRHNAPRNSCSRNGTPRRIPQPSRTSRSALSNWSWAQGSSTCGTPAAKARLMAPIPPGWTSPAHDGSKAPSGA